MAIGSQNDIIEKLITKGVCIPAPQSIEIDNQVNPDRISGEGVVIHRGCKISGKDTLISKGSILGSEAPATLENCMTGVNVKLKGGYFKESVFLKNASCGSCAHVREGTIFEEAASAAHAVGLKQTILFPYVTLGSQINFCDCLMSGGTGKNNHSEVGSSYIHFNFTPQQDKATPSLIGDVPSGVMLNQLPIFLGGQGGLVGPSRLTFGTTIAAGTIFRKDELRPGRLIFGGASKSGNIAFSPGVYSNIKRIFKNNLIYIANLHALIQWYRHTRYLFISNEFPSELLEGLITRLNAGVDERLKQLTKFVLKIKESHKIEKLSGLKSEIVEKWPEVNDKLISPELTEETIVSRDQFITIVEKAIQLVGKDYLRVIKGFDSDDAEIGKKWLQSIVDHLVDIATEGLSI